MLQSPANRTLLDQVKDDSSSLVCLKSRSSLQSIRTASTRTRNSALLSVIFDFDAEILASNVYQRPTETPSRLDEGNQHSQASFVARAWTNNPHYDLGKHFIPAHLFAEKPFPHAMRESKFILERNGSHRRILIPLYGGRDNILSATMDLLKSVPLRGLSSESRRGTSTLIKSTVRSNLISSMQYLFRITEHFGIGYPSLAFAAYASKITCLRLSSTQDGFKWNSQIRCTLALLLNRLASWKYSI